MPGPAIAAPARPVVLHVGTPKSGTTYLQRVLMANRASLRAAGYLYPGDRASHFLPVVDLRRKSFQGHRYTEAEGAWAQLLAEIEGFDGPSLISHEMLGGLRRPVLARAVASFPGRQLRAVVTCRDLGRQMPALWQERVKNGATTTFADYLELAEQGWKESPGAGMPWAGQNLAAVGLPDVDLAPVEGGVNASLGALEVELLRRVNASLPGDLPMPARQRRVKRDFAMERLAGPGRAGALSVPQEHRPALEAIAETMLGQVAAGGYRVVGDLDELRPRFREGPAPEDVGGEALAELAVEQLAAQLLTGRRPPKPPKPRSSPSLPPASLPRRAAGRVAARLRRGRTR